MHKLLGQLLLFSKDFKSALASVRKQQELDAAKAAREAAKSKEKKDVEASSTRPSPKKSVKADMNTQMMAPGARRKSSVISQRGGLFEGKTAVPQGGPDRGDKETEESTRAKPPQGEAVIKEATTEIQMGSETPVPDRSLARESDSIARD